MQNLRLVKRITATLFALAMLWGIFFLSKLFLEVNKNNNHQYVPESSFFVTIVDGRSFAEQGMISLLKDDKNEVINLINQLLERKKGDEEAESTGIVFHSDIVVFKEFVDEAEVTGMIFNLTSEKKFNKNIHQYLNKNQVASADGKIGVILTLDNSDHESTLSLADLEMHANQLLKAEKTLDLKSIIKPSEDESLFSMWSKNGIIQENDAIIGSSFDGKLTDGDFEFNGAIKLSKSDGTSYKRLAPEYSHFSSSIITDAVRDSINAFLADLNLPKVEITSISFNYQGTEIVEEPTFCIVPRIDLLITSNKPYDIEKVIDTAVCHMEDLSMVNKHLHYGGQEFHVQQITPTTFFIGISEKPKIIDSQVNTLLEFVGPVVPLTTFYGDGMMRKFLEIIPIYSASQKLTKRVKNVDVTVVKSKGNEASVHGRIEFIENEDAIKSLIHFAVEGQLL